MYTGLDVCEQFMDVNEMIRDEDLVMQRVNSPVTSVSSHYYSPRPQGNIRHFVANMVPSAKSRRPSARELNLLKRKAKVSSKDQTKGWSKDGEPDAPQPQDMTSPRGIQSDASGSNKMHLDTVSDEDGLESDADGCWPFQSFVEQLMVDMFDPLWEIRHGSVMALREILTHQGANAGAIMPDRSRDVGLGSILKDRVVEKQESVIDLNIQVPLDESEPAFKKPKIEDASPLVMDTIPSASMVGNIDNIQVKVEDVGLNLPVRQENGEVNFGSVKMEIQSNSNSESSFNNYMVEAKSSCEDNISLEKMDLPRNLPENCELMNLVKLARHSWLKNSEFLQDCAIRFLCILSLDRFGDYVSDQVVAPVRETCAQALGAVLKYMHPTLVYETLSILLQMQVNMK
nr:TATA-binding protein-associated factor BTAF1 isoform X1 [Ipomoea batatas]